MLCRANCQPADLGSSNRSSLGGASHQSFAATTARNTSVRQYRHGRRNGESGLNIFNLATLSKTPMSNGSIGQCGTNGCHSTIGQTWQRCIDPVKTRSGHTIGETSHGYDDGRRNQSLKLKGICQNINLKLKLQFDVKLF